MAYYSKISPGLRNRLNRPIRAILGLPPTLLLGAAILLMPADPSRAQTTEPSPERKLGLKKIVYKWKSVRGARGYRVQVRDKDGKVILNERVAINQIQMILRPGEYEHRVAALNKFLRPASWSGWLPFAVRQVRTPVMNALEPPGIQVIAPDAAGGDKPTGGTGDKPATDKPTGGTSEKPGEKPAPGGPREIRIVGDHFLRVTRVRFASGEGDLRVLSSRVASKKLIIVTVDAGALRPGLYDVVITNPGNKQFRGVGAFSITYKKKTVTTVVKKVEEPKKEKIDLPRFSPDQRTASGREQPARPYTREIRPWSPLLPGLTQFNRDDNLEGYIWTGAFGAVTLGALSELAAANRVLGASNGDALQNFFADPVVLIATRSFLPLTNEEVLALGIVAQQQNAALAAKYGRHQQNQAILGGIAVLGYLGHVYRETFRDWKWETAVPGLTQYQSGNYYWAMFWATSVAGFLGGSLYYQQTANNRAASLSGNAYYQLFNNPLVLSAYYNSLTSTSDREAFLLNGVQTVNAASRQEALYNRDRNANAALGGLAVIAYVGHIIHALYFNEGGRSLSARDEPSQGETRSYFTLGAAPGENGHTRTTFRWTLIY